MRFSSKTTITIPFEGRIFTLYAALAAAIYTSIAWTMTGRGFYWVWYAISGLLLVAVVRIRDHYSYFRSDLRLKLKMLLPSMLFGVSLLLGYLWRHAGDSDFWMWWALSGASFIAANVLKRR